MAASGSQHSADFGKFVKSVDRRLNSIERHKHAGMLPITQGTGNVPNPPTWVRWDREIVGGEPATHTQWEPPVTNTDGSPLEDFFRYEVQQQIGLTVSWGDPTEVAPSKPDEALNRLMDRKGMGLGFTGGDGGASHRDDQGRDWWFWSDSNWGELRPDGSTKTWYMLRNSLTRTEGTNRSSTVMKVGHENLLPAVLRAVDYTPYGGARVANVEGGVLWTAEAGQLIGVKQRLSAVPGEALTFAFSMDVEFPLTARIQWQNSAGANLPGAPVEEVDAAPGARVVSVSAVAPAGAVQVALLIRARGAGDVRVSRLYAARGDARMASYRAPVKGYEFTNLMHDPEGRGSTVSLVSTEVWRNIAGNPRAQVDSTSAISSHYGAVITREAVPDAFVGDAVVRINRGNAVNALMALMDYSTSGGRVSPGDAVTARFRVRKRSLTNPASTLQIHMPFYAGSSGVGTGGPNQTITLSDEWTTVTISGVAPDGANRVGIGLTSSGPRWSAADTIEVDARELYVADSLPVDYFDGSTPSDAGYIYEWGGEPHASDSIMYSTSRQRRNVALFPDDPTGKWAAWQYATVRYDGADTPAGGNGVEMPTITNSAALDGIRHRLRTAADSVTGIGVNSDSTGETTGRMENPDLSDRYMETLQRELRRRLQSPGVEVDPVGYYGGSAYVAARFQHPGPVDWVTRGTAHHFIDRGVGGRGFALPYGSSAHLRAVFDSATLELAGTVFGREAAVFVDGVQVASIDTYDTSAGLIQFDTGSLGYGEHLISVESQRQPTMFDGDVRVCGAMLFDEASESRGVRVYDMSASGKALDDHIKYPNILRDGLLRPMDLMIWSLEFNDAGRGITPAQHKANYKTVLARQRANGFTGPTLIFSKWDPGAGVTDGWSAPLDEYRQVMREIAQEDPDVAFFDLGEVMPGPDEDASLYSDWIHQNELGNQRIAAVLLELLSPSGGPQALVVETDAEGQGAQSGQFAVGAFEKDTTWTLSLSVKGPAGRMLRPVIGGPPDATLGDIEGAAVTLTGEWQRISVTGLVEGDAPRMRVVQADSGGPMQWRLSHPLMEEGISSRDYFSGYTADTPSMDYRLLVDGSSVASTYTPLLWQAGARSRVRYTTERSHNFYGAVRVEGISADGDAVVEVASDLGGGPTGELFTLVGWVLPGPGMDRVDVEPLVDDVPTGAFSMDVTPGQWAEFRTEVAAAGGAFSGVRVSGESESSLSVFWLTEVTLVEGEYTAPAFSGGSQGMHAESVWDGTPFASTSTIEFKNTSFTSDPYQNTTLISAEVFGLEGWKFLWCQGAVGVGDTGLMFLQTFYHRPTAEKTGWNFHRSGDIVVARFDLESEALVDAYVLEEGADFQWGEGLWVEGDWLYVYGGAQPGKSVAVRRYPAARMTDRLVGHGQTWTGSAWGGEFDEPGPVASLPIEGGFSAVRTVAGRWVALFTGGFMDHLQAWEALAPEGPFISTDVVWSYPSDGVNRYVPRFHPQFDSGEKGISLSICEAGGIKYQPFFLRGPSGERSAAFNDAYWGHLRYVEDPEHIEIPVGLDEPYAVRVRAVDQYGNSSEWAVGEEVGDGPDMPEVPKPSTPTATSFFRGGRVYWDGTSEWGEPYEGFRHYEVHLSSAEEFDPNNWTRVDTSVVPGGITPISVDTYSTYYVVIVVVTDAGRSEPSDPASFNPERLSDPDLGNTLIDGARLRPGSVNASALTVGTFTDNLLPNSTFEQPSLEDETKPSMWTAGWPRGEVEGIDWEDAGHWERSEDEPVSGSASLRLETFETTWRQVLSDPPIPVLPGDIYYVAARIRTDGIDGDVEVKLLVGETEDDVNGFGTASSGGLLVGRTAGGQSVNLVEGPVEIPDKRGDGSGVAMRFAALAIEAKATGREYTTWVDDVEVRRITGEAAIADASINRAKIRYLAVDDARIANVGVGKLVAGELFADITVSARIMTAKSGRRSEMNKDGYFTFNPYLTSGDDMKPITEVRTEDGGIISRWFRTNTTGTRIEMGSYSMGGNSALMSFHSTGTAWQFPPAVGFGGDFRQGSIPGIGIHAGSYTEDGYQNYGMNMMAVDQVGGITMTTGNLLNGRESDYGAPIRMSAGGGAGVIDIRSGTLFGTGANDRARIYLSPAWPSRDSPPGVDLTRIDLNYGTINFLPAGTTSNVSIRHAREGEWGSTPYYHVLLSTASGGFRIATSATSEALIVSPFGILQGAGWDYAVKLGTEGTGQNSHFATIRYDGSGRPAIRVYNGPAGAMVASKTFVIDHPVREDEYLVHAAVEGPTADVFYRGESRIVDGRATVVLPDYFEALTVPGSATVQVTPIVEDGVMPSPLAATRVAGDRFVVMGTDYASFFWEVKAERARTQFATEPRKDEVRLKGDGPYTYLEPLS